MGDDAAHFLSDFADAWRDARVARLLTYAFAGVIILAIAAAALSDLTRPRVYIVRPGEAEHER